MTCQLRLPDLDAHRLNATRNTSQTSVCLRTAEKTNMQPAYAPEQEQSTLAETSFIESVDGRHQPSVDRHQMDGHEPVTERQTTKERISIKKRMKSWKPYIPKHFRGEVYKVEHDGFHKRVKSIPKDFSFEVASNKYKFGNFFRESRETGKEIELLFNKVSRQHKSTLKKEQDPGKFLIRFCIHSHNLPNALCDTGSAISIMALDSAELLGIKMKPSQDSFTFVDNPKANSAGMIKNVKVEIGEYIIPVDFHGLDIKLCKTCPLLFRRASMATVRAVCDLKKNKMCLTNVDETVFYDPVEKKKSEKFISCLEMFEDPTPPADSNRKPTKPGLA